MARVSGRRSLSDVMKEVTKGLGLNKAIDGEIIKEKK